MDGFANSSAAFPDAILPPSVLRVELVEASSAAWRFGLRGEPP